MKIGAHAHLCYCTNIHPGETWPEVLASLDNALAVRDKMNAAEPFGIGLRLSAAAAHQLGTGAELVAFRAWLRQNNCYVFTMNGFPYGDFHGQVVKDQVHAPDWSTAERVAYTKLLFDQLAVLLPEGMDGGVSTSPISYRFWHEGPDAMEAIRRTGAENMVEVIAHLVALKEATGKVLHLDVEPEPDGVIEDSREFIDFFEREMMTYGTEKLMRLLNCDAPRAKAYVREHFRLCYDVCHFAVAYEEHADILARLQAAGIQVGKVQISAAIRVPLNSAGQRQQVRDQLLPYNESTYLHQTAFRTAQGSIVQYPDLDVATSHLFDPANVELRTHFHVPIFTEDYGMLRSTRSDIEETLRLWQANPFTQHLEVETYTWDVLPDQNQLSLTESIHRELAWVVGFLGDQPT